MKTTLLTEVFEMLNTNPREDIDTILEDCDNVFRSQVVNLLEDTLVKVATTGKAQDIGVAPNPEYNQVGTYEARNIINIIAREPGRFAIKAVEQGYGYGTLRISLFRKGDYIGSFA